MKSNNDRSKTIIRKTTFLLKAQETQLENYQIYTCPASLRKFQNLACKI